MVTQLTGLLGQVGQVASTIPLVAALNGAGWQRPTSGPAAIGVLIAVLVVLVAVRDRPAGREPPAARRELERRPAAICGHSFRQPGTRLGLWTHFAAQFSGMVFALLWGFPFMTLGLGYSPTLAGRAADHDGLHGGADRSGARPVGRAVSDAPVQPDLRCADLTTGCLDRGAALARAAPLPLIVVLVLVLAAYGPASALGFDFARTFNPSDPAGRRLRDRQHGRLRRLADHDLRDRCDAGPAGPPTASTASTDFKIAWCFQYLVWAFGFISRGTPAAGPRRDAG